MLQDGEKLFTAARGSPVVDGKYCEAVLGEQLGEQVGWSRAPFIHNLLAGGPPVDLDEQRNWTGGQRIGRQQQLTIEVRAVVSLEFQTGWLARAPFLYAVWLPDGVALAAG